jgi:hypothetical protein
MLDAARANQTSGTIDGKSGTKPEESGIDNNQHHTLNNSKDTLMT